MVKIRLTRIGRKNEPFYRVVVADQRRARDGAEPQGLRQRLFVDQLAPRGVDQKGARPHQVQPPSVDQARVGAPPRAVQRDEITLR